MSCIHPSFSALFSLGQIRVIFNVLNACSVQEQDTNETPAVSDEENHYVHSSITVEEIHELHFVFVCPQQLYIPEKFYKHPQFHLFILFASNCLTFIQNVAYFLYKALQIMEHNLQITDIANNKLMYVLIFKK